MPRALGNAARRIVNIAQRRIVSNTFFLLAGVFALASTGLVIWAASSGRPLAHQVLGLSIVAGPPLFLALTAAVVGLYVQAGGEQPVRNAQAMPLLVLAAVVVVMADGYAYRR